MLTAKREKCSRLPIANPPALPTKNPPKGQVVFGHGPRRPLGRQLVGVGGPNHPLLRLLAAGGMPDAATAAGSLPAGLRHHVSKVAEDSLPSGGCAVPAALPGVLAALADACAAIAMHGAAALEALLLLRAPFALVAFFDGIQRVFRRRAELDLATATEIDDIESLEIG